MKGFRHLLVALDFTPASVPVLEAALAVADSGATLRLLHVVEWVSSGAEGPLVGYTKARDVQALHRAANEKLERLLARCAGFVAEPLVVDGQVASAILEEAAKGSADLVVLGRRGRGRLRQLRPTGITARVVSAAACPVLVVPS